MDNSGEDHDILNEQTEVMNADNESVNASGRQDDILDDADQGLSKQKSQRSVKSHRSHQSKSSQRYRNNDDMNK